MARDRSTDMHQRLAEARQKAGFATASDAARYFGWNENTYRSHENGERGLKVDVAYKYARAFRIRFEYLMIGGEKGNFYMEDSHVLAGYMNDDAGVIRYPEQDEGKFKRLVAISSALPRFPYTLIEVLAKRPVIGLWPGDLLSFIPVDYVIDTTKKVKPGSIALYKLEDDTEIIRHVRLDKDRIQANIELQPELDAQFVKFRKISILTSIIKNGHWGVQTMEDWKETLLDPDHRTLRAEPSREF